MLIFVKKIALFQGKMTPFDRSMLKGTLWHDADLSYNIFCQHTRWNQVRFRTPVFTHKKKIYLLQKF
jgi:hypothetical protein